METVEKHGQSYAKYTYIFMMHGCDFINSQVDENRCKVMFFELPDAITLSRYHALTLSRYHDITYCVLYLSDWVT